MQLHLPAPVFTKPNNLSPISNVVLNCTLHCLILPQNAALKCLTCFAMSTFDRMCSESDLVSRHKVTGVYSTPCYKKEHLPVVMVPHS